MHVHGWTLIHTYTKLQDAEMELHDLENIQVQNKLNITNFSSGRSDGECATTERDQGDHREGVDDDDLFQVLEANVRI